MNKSFRRNVCLATGALLLSVSLPLTADVVYDNAQGDLRTRFNPANPADSTTTFEVGDQIVLEKTGWLTNFSFEYYALAGADATFGAGGGAPVEGRVVFYRQNGADVQGYASPGQTFYDSGWFVIPGITDRSTMNFVAGLDFAPGGLALPSKDMTWSVQFRGLGTGDEVGLDLFNAPDSAPGFNYPDYWLNNGGWALMEGDVPINFAAKFEANIPEPSSLTLLALGGLGVFLSRRNRK